MYLFSCQHLCDVHIAPISEASTFEQVRFQHIHFNKLIFTFYSQDVTRSKYLDTRSQDRITVDRGTILAAIIEVIIKYCTVYTGFTYICTRR